MIAVLDTESMLGRVWYTPDLEVSGLARQSYTLEYHVYGPVSGPKYHCVPVYEFFSIPGFMAIMAAPVPRPLKYVIRVCWRIAKVLRPPNATLDTILMLTAKFVGHHFHRAKHLQTLSSAGLRGFLYHVRDTLQALAMRGDARYISLAVPNVSTEFSPALVLELQMLLAAENAVHILGWTWEGVKSRIYNPYRRELENEYWKRESEKSRKRRGSTIRESRPLRRQRLS
ncbi:hypothetical protein KVR01_007494 [Diaporthe batatas]|uniref:uncharacterized protein n=1 Tax=Diaporthe batatas TaxID=748121 RepID=UPI001D05B4B3|nr:uncharacterized protein KVR01_007494 [Diaporthe batatas]KAG8163016.1 hypothetical protein KVR01_007494 [Diaporthe batatas]